MNELIIVKQLPEIEEHLRNFKAQVEAKVSEATSLVCTEETLQVVKKSRADLNAQFKELEAARISVKKQILAPYEAFEAVYKECVSDPFKSADMTLKSNIAAVEDNLKAEKLADVKAYYDELMVAEGIPAEVTFESLGIQVTLSVSGKKLRETVKEKLLKIKQDIEMIRQQEYADEIMVEFYNNYDASWSILRVQERHKRMQAEAEKALAAAERKAQEQAVVDKVKEAVEAFSAPTVEEEAPTTERCVTVKFMVTSAVSNIKDLIKYMDERNIHYEQL